MRRVLASVAAVLSLVALGAPAEAYGTGRVLFHFQDDQITESSGIVASSYRDDLFFTHNDSGDTARFFAVDVHGCTLATFNLDGSDTNVGDQDIEDIARGPAADGTSAIFLGDVGDNLHQRAGIGVYVVPEPVVNASAARTTGNCPAGVEKRVPHTRYSFHYTAAGLRSKSNDSETLLVHPLTGHIYVVTKTYWGDSRLYAAPAPSELRADTSNPLTFVAQVAIPPSATVTGFPIADVGRLATTGGDIAPAADRVVIRTYSDAWEWTIPNGDLAGAFLSTDGRVTIPDQIALPGTTQGEAAGYTRDGASLVVTTEGLHAPAHLIPGG